MQSNPGHLNFEKYYGGGKHYRYAYEALISPYNGRSKVYVHFAFPKPQLWDCARYVIVVSSYVGISLADFSS